MRSRCLTVYLLFFFLISVSIPFLFHFLCYLFKEKKRILRNERDAKKKPTKPFKNKKASVKLKKKRKKEHFPESTFQSFLPKSEGFAEEKKKQKIDASTTGRVQKQKKIEKKPKISMKKGQKKERKKKRIKKKRCVVIGRRQVERMAGRGRLH